MSIRVAIVEDLELVRTGLRMILDAADGIEVVGEAADGAEVPDLVRRAAPDVVLMDIRMRTSTASKRPGAWRRAAVRRA